MLVLLEAHALAGMSGNVFTVKTKHDCIHRGSCTLFAERVKTLASILKSRGGQYEEIFK